VDLDMPTETAKEMPGTGPSNEVAGRAPDWSERGIGKSWQHRFFDRLIRILGKRPAYHMAYVVTFWYVLAYPSVRKRCRYYLGRRFPERQGKVRRFLDAYHLIREFGKTLVDITAFGILGKRSMVDVCSDTERILELCRREKGFILLSAHVGCWQVGLANLANLQKPVSLLMVPDPKAQALLDRRAAKVIDPRTGLAGVVAMTQALLHGEILAIMCDRTFGEDHNTIEARFFGDKVFLPLSPYRLASAAGVPVVVLLALRNGMKTYELRLARVIQVAPGLGRSAREYVSYAQQFIACLEEFVQEHPWQFFNFYDLWHDGAATTTSASPALGAEREALR
jgi:predicted LPLAT superfamily acyltransferase